MAWARGMKATRINNRAYVKGYGDEVLPEFGVVYTVRAVVDAGLSSRGSLALLFEEIHNPPRHYRYGFLEPAFDVKDFRPIVTRTEEQDVSMFKRIADSAPSEIIPQVDA